MPDCPLPAARYLLANKTLGGTMKADDTRFSTAVQEVRELEDFFHALLPALVERKLRDGEDVLPYAKALKLQVPKSLRGLDMTWDAAHSRSADELKATETLVLVRPGHPDAVGLTIGCIRVGKWRICLECGWFWCRIVISRRF
jgi:hypothetical protein